LIRPRDYAGDVEVKTVFGFPHAIQTEFGGDDALLIWSAIDGPVFHRRELTRGKYDLPHRIGEGFVGHTVEDHGSHGDSPGHGLVAGFRINGPGEPVEIFLRIRW